MRGHIATLQESFGYLAETTLSILKRERLARSRIYSNSMFLIADSVASAVLGFVFWIVVARLYPTESVGLGSALTSAVLLLSFLARFGLGFGIIRFLPGAAAGGARLINSCFTLAGLSGVTVALVFLVGLPWWSSPLLILRQNPLAGASFVAFVVAGTIFGLLNEVFVALRRAEFVLVQGVIVGSLRLLVAVLVAGVLEKPGIFTSWGLALTVAVGAGVFLFLPRLNPTYRPEINFHHSVSRVVLRFSFVNFISSALWSSPYWVLPLMVITLLGSEANAYFFVCWAIAGHLFAIPWAISMSLFSESSRGQTSHAANLRRSLGLIAVTLLPALLAVVLLGEKLLALFGEEYSLAGAELLWVLALSAIPLTVNVVYLGIARARMLMWHILLTSAGVAVLTLVLSYLLLPALGLVGAGVAWMVGNGLVGIPVAFSLVRLLRPPATSPSESP